MRYLLIALALIVAVAVALALSSERNRNAIFNRSGAVQEGSKFGIFIGAAETDTIDKLRKAGWYYVGHQDGGYCIRTHYPSDNSLQIFSDQSWRKITLCVVSKDGRVATLQWYSWAFSPES